MEREPGTGHEATEADGGAGRELPAGINLAATPIGNPADASERLRHALGAADIVAAEDTRRARALAAALGVEIGGRVVSFFEHNETARAPWLIERAEAGDSVLVVTDAGMPSVSDPGFAVVSEAMTAEVPITCLPGPSAVTTALVLSGLPVDRFAFDGFPPRKAGKRRTWLAGLADERRTVVFFESPHRLRATLADAAEVLGAERPAAVCRELTKTYEEVLRGGLGELAERTAGGVLGEIVVVLGPAEEKEATVDDVESAVDEVLRLAEAERIRVKDAAGRVAAASGLSRKTLYDAAVSRH
ncbi:16S rRNA (cytidine(1402)-2'-O)-methyltransferase [Dietzia sp.]|uniref:16S rRNA (cytidine(1402)-2'-O)-methyltransferase n=1 Tax=Dietzia sp. TaxID=1871616 RepID=UPI002FDA0111